MRPIVERFPRLAAIHRFARDSRIFFQEPIQTPKGFRLIGSLKMLNGTFEPDEYEIVKKCLNKSDLFVNIGANVGYYCCIALKAGKPTIAFEPNEINVKCLYQNILVNGWSDQIEIYPIALSNRTGLIKMYGDGTGSSLIKGWAGMPERIRKTVPMSTLDNVLGERAKGKKCFVLVDIEGS